MKTKKKISKESKQKRKNPGPKRRLGTPLASATNATGSTDFPKNPLSLTNTLVQKSSGDKLYVKPNNPQSQHSLPTEADFHNDWRQYTLGVGRSDSSFLGKNKEAKLGDLIDDRLLLTNRIQSQIERADEETFNRMKQHIIAEEERMGRSFGEGMNLFESLTGNKNGTHHYLLDAPDTGRPNFAPISPVRFPNESSASLMNTLVGKDHDRPAQSLLASIAPGHFIDHEISMNRGYSQLSFDNLGQSRNTSYIFQPLHFYEEEESRRKMSDEKKKLHARDSGDKKTVG